MDAFYHDELLFLVIQSRKSIIKTFYEAIEKGVGPERIVWNEISFRLLEHDNDSLLRPF